MGCPTRLPVPAAAPVDICSRPWHLFWAQEVVPGMEEAGLLADALKQLDEPFLVVVVGEFNSGKSTVHTRLAGAVVTTTVVCSVQKQLG